MAPEQLTDHSELASLYPDARIINENPISTQAEREKRALVSRDKNVQSLRRWAVPIGLYLSLPYVIGAVVIQHVILRIPNIAPGDIGGAMFVVFMSFFTAFGTVAATYLLLRKAASYFYARALKMWPVGGTILACVALLAPLAFEMGSNLQHDGLGYAASLALILASGIVVSVISISLWTTKLPIPAKLSSLSLLVLLALSALLFL